MYSENKIIKHIPKNPISFGIAISKLHWKYAIPALFFVFLANAAGKFTVIIISNLTDSISAKPPNFETIWLWGLTYPLLHFISQNIWRLSGFTGMRWFMNLRFTATQTLYQYLTHHSKEYFNNRFAGTLSNKIANAVDGTEELFEAFLWQFLGLFLSLCWYSAFTFKSDYRLGLIILIWSILFISINIWFAKKLQYRSIQDATSESTLKGRIVDSLSNISLVHEYAYITGETEYIKTFAKKSKDAGLSVWSLSEWMLCANGLFITIFMSLMLGTSIYLFLEKIVTAGVIIMVIAIILNLSEQLLFLGQQIRNAAKLYGKAKEGLEEILQKHNITDSTQALDVKIINASIDFESVDFDYENKNIFKNFTLHIPSGQKIGLVGKSGAGKTTFVSLLLRHYDIKNGVIKIDGQNISHITLESLRRSIGFVPQDTSLFHRTISENISYSNSEASSEDIVQAAKLAHADEFINELPDGYDSMVGERGVKLSGGQRQRIALARAFLKNAPILILDEATSSLDSKSEYAIQESLEKLMNGRTVIAIAHRLSTLKNMDRIVVIDGGQIIEDGKPNDLLSKPDGIFKNLWDHQVKGFIIDE